MKIVSTNQQVSKTESQNQTAVRVNAAKNGTDNNANNNAAVSQSTAAKTDTVTLSKESLVLAAKTVTKSEPKVGKAFGRQSDVENFEHRLGVVPVTKEAISQSIDNGHGNGTINSVGDAEEGSGKSSAVSLFSLSNNISAALESYKYLQKAEAESKGAVGVLA